jgi:hypothetical protein
MLNKQTRAIVRPLENTPRTKLYLYRKRICSEYGLLHLYRKVDEEKFPVVYGCGRYSQLWLVGDESTIKQERLF